MQNRAHLTRTFGQEHLGKFHARFLFAANMLTESPKEVITPTAGSKYLKVASHEAHKGEFQKCLLLYSGGLDTSVMLKWIQVRLMRSLCP